MSCEGFEEWDADFLDQAIQIEERALSSANPTQPPPSSSSHFPPSPRRVAVPCGDVSYSPPRELSQRVRDSNTKDFDQSFSGIAPSLPYVRRKEEEVERLKRELSRVSKQLTNLEQDCLQLRKERDKKEDQLKSVCSQIEAKDTHYRRNKNLECEVHTQHCQNKLLAVWDLPSGQASLRDLVPKLLAACETDLRALFGCLSFSSKAPVNSLADERYSDLVLQDHKPPAQSAETEKVSRLYSILTKIGAGMVKLDTLFEALLDLCSLRNDVIIYRSLRVLRMVLNYTFHLKIQSHRRDNVIVEGPSSPSNIPDMYGFEYADTGSCINTNDSGLVAFRTRLANVERLWKKQQCVHGSVVLTSCLDWVSVFELMHQITMQNAEECVRLEAVSIMNMILIRSNAYLDREKFARVLVFQSISHLLKKESGLGVQKQAVHLLFLLLNCPKLMLMFCLGCKEEVGSAKASNSDVKNASTAQDFRAILEGLADCVACGGNGIKELKLRRSAVTLLAFLACSGKPGFDILLGHKLQKRTNFLALILQMLVSEMDMEVVSSSQPPETSRERALLLREALILLNRLVSNPQYSTPVLRVLTNTRDVACLTVEIANRLSCKVKWLWQSDSMTRQMRGSEILDLARVFKKRVFTFLGDGNMSKDSSCHYSNRLST